MNKYLPTISLALLISFCFIPAVNAEMPFRAEINAIDGPTYPGETAKFCLNVTNNYKEEVDFKIELFTMHLSWFQPTSTTLTVAPNQTTSLLISARPPADALAGNKGFHAYIKPKKYPEDQIRREGYVRVKRNKSMIITSFNLSNNTLQPRDTVKVSAEAKNVGASYARGYKLSFDLVGKKKDKEMPRLRPGETFSATVEEKIGDYVHGNYNVTVQLKDVANKTRDRQQSLIQIGDVEQVEETRSKKQRYLWASYQIKLENKGNIEVDKTLEGRVNSLLSPLVTIDSEADNTYTEDNQKVYQWQVSLKPGESTVINYRINYWVLMIIVALIVIVSSFAYRELKTGKVVKRADKINGQHSIKLFVRNKTHRTLKKVKVTDYVPGIADLVEQYDANKPVKVQEGSEKTTINWDIGNVAAGEERILNYRIKQKVETEGTVDLPKAELSYEEKGKEKMRTSNIVHADFSREQEEEEQR